jgi:hypothetical protein
MKQSSPALPDQQLHEQSRAFISEFPHLGRTHSPFLQWCDDTGAVTSIGGVALSWQV